MHTTPRLLNQQILDLGISPLFLNSPFTWDEECVCPSKTPLYIRTWTQTNRHRHRQKQTDIQAYIHTNTHTHTHTHAQTNTHTNIHTQSKGHTEFNYSKYDFFHWLFLLFFSPHTSIKWTKSGHPVRIDSHKALTIEDHLTWFSCSHPLLWTDLYILIYGAKNSPTSLIFFFFHESAASV